ncbi:hypothetical protein OHA63_00945 [Streptomyces anulatus]|uniref:hypothetical protein n=1 Tax=Streptomyces anulatus TaxID=1892 RepID=UPI002E37E6DD|nr:hypothetical protein [Streptomyces anulatus]
MTSAPGQDNRLLEVPEKKRVSKLERSRLALAPAALTAAIRFGALQRSFLPYVGVSGTT